VVSAKWDFEGVGTYREAAELGDPTSATVYVATTHAFSKPGTYFPTLRVASQREGNPGPVGGSDQSDTNWAIAFASSGLLTTPS
jgi:hypothetical protein